VLAVALAAAVLLLPLAWALRSFRGVDDVQITFVFARSFAEGSGLTWKGAPVLGTSSPFLAVVLGALARASGVDVALLGIALGWASIWAAAVALYLLGRAEGWPRAGLLAALVWILVGFRLHLGGEYLPAVAMALCGAVAFRSGRPLLAGSAVALAAMFRAEVGLAAPLFALARVAQVGWRRGWKEVARAALLAIAVTGVWLLLLYGLAGAVLPQTVEAKRAQAESELGVWDPEPPLAELAARPGAGFPGRLEWLYWTLAAAGAAFLGMRSRMAPFAIATVLWGIGHWLALDALDVAIYPWYATPIRLAAYLLACLAVEAPRLLRGRARTFAVVVVAALVSLALVRQIRVQGELLRIQHDGRAKSYQEVGEVADRYPYGTELASFEVGFVGFATEQPVLDLLGLVTPEASLDAVRSGDLARNVTELEPDLLMVPLASGSLYFRTMGEPREFLARYELDHLALDTGFPVALYRKRAIAGRSEVAHDLLVRAAAGGRVFRTGTGDLQAMLAVPVRGGESLALAVPPGKWGGLRLAVASDREGALAVVVVRSPPLGRIARSIPTPARTWRWETLRAEDAGSLETAPHARLVLRCQAPPEVTCSFGQPHLLRAGDAVVGEG
jgi:hypothetical protein